MIVGNEVAFKAYLWQEQFESGIYASLEELAAAHGVDR